MKKKIGILALQGGFDLHAGKVREFGAEPVLVKRPEELSGISGLIIPGGESSVLLHLTDAAFRKQICDRVKNGLPLLATCAGLIFIADKVENPAQESLSLLPVEVKRNAYGRQRESFIAESLPWEAQVNTSNGATATEAVFIRAPRVVSCAKDVEVLLRYEGDPILVKKQNIVGATFHPELSQGISPIYPLAFAL